MHPQIERELAAQKIEELRRAGAATRRMVAAQRVTTTPEVVIRGARPADDLSLAALAVLDDAEQPMGPVLVAEVDGSIRAALPLDGSRPFADPFRRTADLVALLKARAAQLEAGRDGRRRPAWLAPAARRRVA